MHRIAAAVRALMLAIAVAGCTDGAAVQPSNVSPTPSGVEPTTELRSPTADALQNCEFAAHDASEHYSTRVVVAGAIDTDVAGLRRAAADAITFKPGVDDPAKWPGTDGSASATLCFLDGDFEEVPGYPAPVERLVIGYTPHGWDVLDFGPTARLPVVEP